MERQPPPQLPPPDCPICEQQTEVTDVGYACSDCRVSWTSPTQPGTWDEPDALVCRATVVRGGRTFHCIQREGHVNFGWHYGAWHNGTEPVYIEWRS